jgi:flagellar motility protein MotE (MotC chaperone)
MAKNEKEEEQTPVPQGSDQGEKPGGILHSIIVVLLALLIVAVVTAGVFYFAVKKNINGFAYNVKPEIENHPILKYALPKEMIPVRPDDPENLSEKELLKKYEEYRTKNAELEQALAKANEAIDQMKKEAGETSDSKALLEENQKVLDETKLAQAELETGKKALSEMIAKGDSQGFRDYFEQVDKSTAESIYKEVITEEAISQNKLSLAKPFSLMQPQSAAGVLNELFNKDRNTALDIFEGLKPNASALILEQMDAKTAAEITKMLSDRKQGR